MDTGARGSQAWFTVSVVKDPEAPDQNEDVCKFDQHSGVLALSDGAGESFDPRRWSDILTSRFVSRPDPSLSWLDEAVAEYLAAYDREGMSWSGQAAFDRGSFATLLGVRVLEGEVEILAVGDSLAVLLDRGELIDSFPYRQAADFSRRPTLLATCTGANAFRNDLDRGNVVLRWPISDLTAPTILCMTDALGAWLLELPKERCEQLLSVRDEAAFQALVREERAARRMRQDDTTLAVLTG